MPRPRSPNRDKARQLWLESNKKRPLKDIAAELSVSEEQVRKWKNQDKWDKVTLPIIEAASQVTETRLEMRVGLHQEIRMQLQRESLRLSFLIVWSQRKRDWRMQYRRIRSSSFFRKSGC